MKFQTIKQKILLLTLVTMTVIAVAVAWLTAALYSRSAMNERISAISMALEVENSSLAKDLEDVERLRRWVRQSEEVSSWLLDSGDDYKKILAYSALTDAYSGNGFFEHLARVIVVDQSEGTMIQVGSNLVNSDVVSSSNIADVVRTEDLSFRYSPLRYDPLFPSSLGQVFTVIEPLYTISKPGVAIGYLYLEIPVSFITDQLSELTRQGGGPLLLKMGTELYASADGKEFVPYEARDGKKNEGVSLSPHSACYEGEGKVCVLTTLSKEDISVGWVQDRMLPSELGTFALLLLGILLFIALVWAALQWYLGALINRPVARLLKRLKAIGNSNFDRDPSVEDDSEFGQIGKGMNQLALEVDHLIKAQVEDEGKRKDMEYRMLQYQISPHFLNNTLNSIKWMATIQKAPGIAEMVTALSHLLKSVSNSKESICTISEELSLLDDYFTIQSYRYGGTISFVKDVDASVLGIQLPRFTFQPIVENAIFHGIAPKGKNGTIRLRSIPNGETVDFKISDDGVGMNAEQLAKLLDDEGGHSGSMFSSIGLTNVNKRIKHYCGDGYGMRIVSTEGVGTTVTVTLPMEKKGTEK